MPTTTVSPSCTRDLQLIADSIARSKKTIVITGAGISTSAGIPDFRSSDGLYNLVKAQYPDAVVKGRDLFDSVLFSDPTSTSLFYTFLASLRKEALKANPTPTHKFIRTLTETGRLLRCYTQNIDGLEQREGLVTDLSRGKGKRKRSSLPAEAERPEEDKGCQVVQLHGDLASLRCNQCQTLFDYTLSHTSTLLSGAAPPCPSCEVASETRLAAGKRGTKVGALRPNVVLYGEEHPCAESIGSLTAADLRAAPDMLIIMGTSLKVHGLKRIVREFSKAVHAKGGSVVFVNNTPPPESVWRDIIDYHVSMSCDAWVADVKLRRAGIWDRQTVLPLPKVVKSPVSPLSKQKARLQKENVLPGTPKKAKSAPSTPSGRKRAPLGATSGNAYLPTPSSTNRSKKTPASRRRQSLKGTDIEDTPSKKRKLSSKTGLATPPPTPSCQRMVAVQITSPKKPSTKSQIFEESPRTQLLRELNEDLSDLSDLSDLDVADDEILIAGPNIPKKVSKTQTGSRKRKSAVA